MNIKKIKEYKVLKTKLLTDLSFFTRFFFKQINGQNFILNWHHKYIFKKLEQIYNKEIDNLIINIPPRHSKTTLVLMFTAWCLAKQPKSRFLYISNGDKLVNENSRTVREIINLPIYQELFNVRISLDTTAKGLWRTEDNGGITTATIQGSISGFGAGAINDYNEFYGGVIIDDPNKIADFNTERETMPSQRWIDTIRSRRNGKKTPTILIQQRTYPNDLTGYFLNNEINMNFTVIKLPVIYNNKPLWEFKMDMDDIKDLENNPETSAIFETQYMQNPVYKKGKMFNKKELQFFNDKFLQKKRKGYRIAYIDDADEGDDYFAFGLGELIGNYIYITDIIFNQKPLASNEKRVIDLCNRKKIHYLRPEINKRGKYFEQNLKNSLNFTWVDSIFNTKNKQARIYYQETNIKKRFIFRVENEQNFEYKKAMEQLYKYNRISKNKHDDVPDMLAGLAQYAIEKKILI